VNCSQVEERDLADQYLLDLLTEPEREEFEVHYFECESCFSDLQTRRAVQDELRLQSAPVARVGLSWFRLPVWVPGFVAVFLLIGLGIWWRRASSIQPVMASSSQPTNVAAPTVETPSAAPLLERLAHVMPPPYVAVALRGPEDRAQEEFRQAMQYYVEGDYGNAIGGLRAAAIASPRTPAFSFYLGACYLLTHQVENAIDALRKTVSLGDSSYLESAHFLLAKAYLAEGRVPAAQDEFKTTIRFGGSKQSEAREILGQLQR
jgi:TolA-binding protein